MKIAVFYHCILSGGTIPIDTSYACALMADQMDALKESGLLAACDDFFIGINGGGEDVQIAKMIAPAKAKLLAHGPNTTTEIPTMKCLQGWALQNPDCRFMYHHIKGVTHPGDANYQRWRENMEKVCVWGWRNCIENLDSGFDAAGAHWLTPEKYPSIVQSPFFGGTFWWATARYLMQLPDLPEPTWQNRFEAEGWIGKRRPYPRVIDYSPYWPI